jgi:hypothetical protein
MNMPYLDHTGSGYDSKKTGDSNCLTSLQTDNREKTRVVTEAGRINPVLKIHEPGKWSIG